MTLREYRFSTVIHMAHFNSVYGEQVALFVHVSIFLVSQCVRLSEAENALHKLIFSFSFMVLNIGLGMELSGHRKSPFLKI